MIHWGTEDADIAKPIEIEFIDKETLDPFSTGQQLLASPSTENLQVIRPTSPHVFRSERKPSDANSSPQGQRNSLIVDSAYQSASDVSSANHCDACKSMPNLIGAAWQRRMDPVHFPFDGPSLVNCCAILSNPVRKATRKTSVSCEDFSSISMCSANNADSKELQIHVDAPMVVNKGDNLSCYLVVENNSETTISAVVFLRIDVGNKKLRLAKRNVSVNADQTNELAIHFPANEFWQHITGAEKRATVFGTVHLPETGVVLSRIEHVLINHSHKKHSLPRKFS